MVETSVTSDPLLSALPRDERGLPKAGTVSIVKKLGGGGMGTVYLGRDTSLDIDVAVKILSFHLVSDEEYVRRFKREAKTAARIDHANLVRVYAVSEEGGVHYLVQEFVDGESAGKRIEREGPFSEADALDVCIGAGEALIEAHAKNIIHRDIKPDNIMIRFEDGRIKVADLGLAKSVSAGGATGMTGSGRMMGTPAFMPPEQATDAKDVDTRSDVYSLGATLYALLTGQPPFTSQKILDLLQQVVSKPPPDVRRRRADVSEATVLAINRALQKVPAARFAGMQEMVAALKTARWTLGRAPTRLARPQMAGTTADLDAIVPVQAPTPGARKPDSSRRYAAGLDTQSADLAERLPCHKCGAPNKEGSRFCKKCGVSLVVKCPKCRKEVPADTQFCPHCGTNIPVLRAALRELKAAQDALKAGSFEKAKAAASSAATTAPQVAAVKRLADDIAGQAEEAARTRAIAVNMARHKVWRNAAEHWSSYLTFCPGDEEAQEALKKVRRIAGHKARAKKAKTVYVGLAAGAVALLLLVLIITGRKPPTPGRGEPTARPAPPVQPQAVPSASATSTGGWREAVIQTFDFEEKDAERLGDMQFVKGERVPDGRWGSKCGWQAAWFRGSSAVLATLKFEGEGLKLAGGHCIAFAYKVNGTKDFRLGMQTCAKKAFKRVLEGGVQGTWQVAQVPLAGWSEDKNPKEGDLIRYFLFHAGKPGQVAATLTIDNVLLLSRKLNDEELAEAMRELFPPGQVWRDAVIEAFDFETEEQMKRFWAGKRTMSGGYAGSRSACSAEAHDKFSALLVGMRIEEHPLQLTAEHHVAFAYRLEGTTQFCLETWMSAKQYALPHSPQASAGGEWHVLQLRIVRWFRDRQPREGDIVSAIRFRAGKAGRKGVSLEVDNVMLLRRELTDVELAEAMKWLSEKGKAEPQMERKDTAGIEAGKSAIRNLQSAIAMPAAPVMPPPSGVVWYVDIDAKRGRKTGKSWADAFLHPQDAVDAAGKGDEIWVAQGTYTRRKQGDTVLLTLKSGVSIYGGFTGAEAKRNARNPQRHMTVLDGQKAVYSVVKADRVKGITFSGFTVRCGAAAMEKDAGHNEGGGLVVSRCENLLVEACLFEENCAYYGGGAYVNDSRVGVEIAGCTFAKNRAVGEGAGLYAYHSLFLITRCTFSGNEAKNGGGIRCYGSSPTVAQCTFAGNIVEGEGGAILISNTCSPTMTNCVFAANKAGGGGAICCNTATPSVTNCTFYGNDGGKYAGGVQTWGCPDPLRAVNCVFWKNKAGKGVGPDIHSGKGPPQDLRCCLLMQKGGYTDGGGNIRDAPLFVDAENGDFRLMAASPCVDAGTSEGAPATDIDGTKRPQGKAVDIGAYEYAPPPPRAGTVWYVDIDAKRGRKTGKSWADAFLHPQDAVNAAKYGDEIWVAEGTYTRRKQTDDILLNLRSGIRIYGGFSGKEATRDTRDPKRHVSTLDGEKTVVHVVNASNVKRTTFSGFTVRRGVARKKAGGSHGAGLCVGGCENLLVEACLFKDNSASTGGGVFIYRSSLEVEIAGCTFAKNTAAGGGGGIYSDQSSFLVTRCTFSQNKAGGGGGGMALWLASSPTVTGCTFTGNTAKYGRGIECHTDSSPTITNCIFARNTGTEAAGAVHCNQRCSPVLTNCTFCGNSGHSLSAWGCREPYRIKNCIFWGDTAKKEAPDIVGERRFLVLSFCCIRQKKGYTDGGGNIRDDPLFVDAENGDFHLKPGSPCIDSGTREGAPATDIEDNRRPQGRSVDMGAHEQ